MVDSVQWSTLSWLLHSSRSLLFRDQNALPLVIIGSIPQAAKRLA